MSDSKNDLVDETINQEQETSSKIEDNAEMGQDDSVAYATHKKLLSQYKQNQGAAKNLAARIAELESEKENAQKSKLEEKQEYKKLYDNALGKIRSMETEAKEKESALVSEHKRRALEKELGGLRKSEYFKFADLSNIVIGDDGLVDENSVKFEANRYRQEFPELLQATKKVQVNNQAPSNDGIVKPERSLKEMNRTDRSESKRDYLRKKK